MCFYDSTQGSLGICCHAVSFVQNDELELGYAFAIRVIRYFSLSKLLNLFSYNSDASII
jgi:hypothetical protein